jgi:hypothetical protein
MPLSRAAVARHARVLGRTKPPLSTGQNAFVGHDKADTGHCYPKQQLPPGSAARTPPLRGLFNPPAKIRPGGRRGHTTIMGLAHDAAAS